MTIHSVPGVLTEPEIILVEWKVLAVNGHELHLSGYDVVHREGRVSSTVLELSDETGIATTKSGRTYRIEGPPGNNQDALYIWRRWININKVEMYIDVSDQFYKKNSES